MLMNDPTWRQYLTAAAAYTARLVYSEADTVPEHAKRYAMALEVLIRPDAITDRLVTLVSTDTDICTQSGVPANLTEQSILDNVMSYWTPIAQWKYPEIG
jgi:hypothetical protein